MSDTPLLDRILDDLACDIELERRLQERAMAAVQEDWEHVSTSFQVLCDEVLPFCGGDDWKVLTSIWGRTWLLQRGGAFLPVAPGLVAAETGLSVQDVRGALDFFVERGVLEHRLPSSPDRVVAYRLRIRSLEVE